MKKIILVFALSTLMAGAVFTSCNIPDRRVEQANDDVIAAKKALDEANAAYLADMTTYKVDMLTRITSYNLSIIDFKEKAEREEGNKKIVYEMRIADLQQRNNAMKKAMEEYKPEGKDKWKVFKTEFNHDMDELGKAFKDLTIKNIK